MATHTQLQIVTNVNKQVICRHKACTVIYTDISKKVVIVNSRYRNRKEVWGSSSTNSYYWLAFTWHDIECNNLRWRVITHYNCTQSSFRFRYRLLIMATIFEIAVFYNRTLMKNTFSNQGPVVQSPISTNLGLTLNETYVVDPGLVLIGLWTNGPGWGILCCVVVILFHNWQPILT